MPPITAPAPSEVMGIHANCVNICRSRFAARSASDPDASMPGARVFRNWLDRTVPLCFWISFGQWHGTMASSVCRLGTSSGGRQSTSETM